MSLKLSRARFVALIGLVALPLLAGCGGGDSEGDDLPALPFVPASLTVNWPERSTKAIAAPTAANSVVLRITPIGLPKGVLQKAGSFDRLPGKNDAHSRTYTTALDVAQVGGTSTVVVEFYSVRGAAGSLLASGTTRVTFDETGNIGDIQLQGRSIVLKNAAGKTIEMEPTE